MYTWAFIASAVTDITLTVTGPNHFNPATSISFYLPRAARVQLHVFNVAGQKVATLVNEWHEAGEHKVTFTANNLSSGIYFMRLTGGTTVLTKKVVLLR